MSLAAKVFESFAVRYRASFAKSLNAYGLRYDDILLEDDDVQKAISRLSPADTLSRLVGWLCLRSVVALAGLFLYSLR
jgi:hypothetical protein